MTELEKILEQRKPTPTRPDGFEYWIFTHGRGSTSFHELWKYDGTHATVIDESFAAVAAEHGPIDEWYE